MNNIAFFDPSESLANVQLKRSLLLA